MRIAVVGAGLAGLAAVWHLLQKGHDVTLFDGKGIGGGASGVSTGLLHTSPGRQAIPSWRADEGMKATLELLQIASQERPVYIQNGILRLAITEQQKIDFKKQPGWLENHSLPKATPGPALWIPEGITVYSRLYLEGLWKACQGAKLEKQTIHSLQELDSFDLIVLACGEAIRRFADLPLSYTIGQTLLCRWPEPLPVSLLSHGHITPTENPELCQVGSTYEHTPEPDPKKALELLEKVALFYPPAKDFQIVEIRSGVRVSPKVGYRPLIEKISHKALVFTGLGSRGLLYHALISRVLNNFLT